MKEVNPQADLNKVESCLLFSHFFDFSEMVEPNRVRKHKKWKKLWILNLLLAFYLVFVTYISPPAQYSIAKAM